MGSLNGVDPQSRSIDIDLEEADVAQTTLQQQMLRDLDEKVDDIRGSVATLAISQATMAGDVKLLDQRIEALEATRVRDEWRAWAERLGSALIGAGSLELARRLLPG